jgi:hypothetical protein
MLIDVVGTAYEPGSKLAEQILIDCFRPHATLLGEVVALADHYDVPVAEVEACIAEYVAGGLVEQTAYWGGPGPRPVRYRPTDVGWRAREHYLRSHGLRHRTLIDQASHDPKDLIVAVLMYWHFVNDRMTGTFGTTTSTEWRVVEFYLDVFTPAELEAARQALISDRLLDPEASTQENHIDLTEKGKKRYRSEIAPRLHLGSEECILDLVLDKNIRVFFSWQSEFSTSRNLIKGVLKKVVKTVNARKPVRPLELIQATALGDGAVRIDVQLMTLIKEAHLVVADVTPVASDNGRRRVNDNVLIEVGYALASKEPGQVLLLAMRRDDLPEGNLAFDIANVQRIEITPDGKKDGRVQAEFEAMLRRKGWLAT